MASGRSIQAGRADILLSIRDRTAQGLRQAETRLNSFAAKTAKLGLAIGAIGAAPLAGFAKSVQDFGRIEQLFGRFSSVFKTLSGDAGKFADKLAVSINQSSLVIRDQLAQFQAFLSGLGFDAEAAFSFSKTLVEAAQDITAFDDNIRDSQEAVETLLSSLAGQTRPIRKYGADIQDVAIQQELLATGAKKVGGEFTQLQKVTPRINIIMRSLSRSGITGQAVREVDTLQSRVRGLSAAFLDMRVALGEVLSAAGIPGYIAEASKALRVTADWIKANETLVQILGKVSVGAVAASGALLGISGAASFGGSLIGAFSGLAGRTQRAAQARLAARIAGPAAIPGAVGGAFSGVDSKLLNETFRQLRKEGLGAADALAKARAAAIAPSRAVTAGGITGSALAAAGTGFGAGSIALVAAGFGVLAVAAAKAGIAIERTVIAELEQLKKDAAEAANASETTTKAIDALGGVLTVQRPEARAGLVAVAQSAQAELEILRKQIAKTDAEFQKAFIGSEKADALRERLGGLNDRLKETADILKTVTGELAAQQLGAQSLARERFDTLVNIPLGEVQTPIDEQRRIAERVGKQQRKNFEQQKEVIDSIRKSLAEEEPIPIPEGFLAEDVKRLFAGFDAGTLLEDEFNQLFEFVREINRIRIQRSLRALTPTEAALRRVDLQTATKEDLDALTAEARDFQQAFDPFARLRERQRELERFGGFLSDFARQNVLKEIRDEFDQAFAPNLFAALDQAKRELDPLLDIRRELEGLGLGKFLPELEELEQFRKQQPGILPSEGTFFGGGIASRAFAGGRDPLHQQIEEQKKTVKTLDKILTEAKALNRAPPLRFR